MSTAPQSIAAAPQYAGFWIRCGAQLLDFLWLVPLVCGAGFVVFGPAYFNVDTGAYRGLGDFIFTNVSLALAVLTFWFVRQATPGKILLRLKIVDAATQGKPTPRQLLIRYFAYALGLIFAPAVIIMMLGCLWVAIDRRRQSLHDKLAGTIVIRVDD